MAKKILIISNKVVFPSMDGGAVAMQKLAKNLISQSYQLDIICINKNDTLKSMPKKYLKLEKNQITQTQIQKNMSFNLLIFVTSIIKQKAYQATRFYDLEIQNMIQEKIDKNKYTAIIFESIFTTIYLNKLILHNNPQIILRAHNIEHKIWKNLARHTISKKLVFLLLAHQIKKMETEIPKYVDYIFTLSEKDQQYFQNIFPKKTHNIPVTFDIENISHKKVRNSIVHLGAMDWKPNTEGISWFLQNVHPQLEDEDITIYIAGKNMPKKYFNYVSPNTVIEGAVKNAKNYIKNKEVVFVPLLSGSGVRIKILESMALGIPVVSTRKGAEGIPYTDRKNIFIANSPLEFKNALCILIQNKQLAAQIGKEGQRLIQEHFSDQIVTKKLRHILQ